MDQTTMRSALCCEVSRALHAAAIAPAGAAAVQQKVLAAQAAAASGIGGRAWRDAGTTPMPPGDDHHSRLGLASRHEVNEEIGHFYPVLRLIIPFKKTLRRV